MERLKNFFVRWRKTKIILLSVIVLVLISVISLKTRCFFVQIPTIAESETSKAATFPENLTDYLRTEESTYLTYPEWHIVYSSEEYANWLKSEKPSGFPYFSSIGQFWTSYCAVYKITSQQYGFNMGDHFMLWVIGVSFSVENAVKSVYENTIGRVTEFVGDTSTEEDVFAYEANKEYVAFIYDNPWYLFSYTQKLKELWTDTSFFGPHVIRKWERKTILSLEFAIKAVYGGIIKFGTRSLYGVAPLHIYAKVENISPAILAQNPKVEKTTEDIIKIPRYRLFTEIVPKLAVSGVEFKDIAGNDEIFMTVIAKEDEAISEEDTQTLFDIRILTRPGYRRIGLRVPVESLSTVIRNLLQKNVVIEHMYDY